MDLPVQSTASNERKDIVYKTKKTGPGPAPKRVQQAVRFR